VGKKKLGGILTELSLNSDGNVDYAVVGIGVNCSQAVEDFPKDIQQIATSLSLCTEKTIDRTAVIAQILVALQQMSQQLHNPVTTLARYRQDCITIGQEISLVRGNEISHGTALDVDESGALVVRFADEKIAVVNSGEVSVRGMYGYV
jgi:BirA family biotin operon repressor/biotin-[acetyl-CoA-carboxylase] ligase